MDADLLVQQALDCLKRSEHEKAVALLKRAARLAPMRADIRDLLLVALERRGPAAPSPAAAEPERRPEPPAAGGSPRPGKALGAQEMRNSFGRSQPPAATEATAPMHLRSGQPAAGRLFGRRAAAASAMPIGHGLPPRTSRVPLIVAVVLIGLALAGAAVYFGLPHLGGSGGGLGGLVKASPSPTPTPDPEVQRRADLRKEADALAEADKPGEAADKLAEALTTNPAEVERDALRAKIGELRALHGEALTKQRSYDEAVKAFKQALDIDVQQAEWHFGLGRAFYLRGATQKGAEAKADYAKAREAFERAVKMDPDLLRAYQSLALACAKLGDLEAEKNAFWEVIRRAAPDSSEAALALRDLKGAGLQTPPPAAASPKPHPPKETP